MSPPRKPADLIREASKAENVILLAIQVDQTMRVVEAIGGLLMAVGFSIRDEEALDPSLKKMPKHWHGAFARLEKAMAGEQA